MAQNSNIEWTDATFNPWRGCQKVSAGCTHCYAETLSKRNPAALGEWGPNGKRAMASESYWKLPEQWDRAAAKDGVRRKVFCASLADVFEDREELHLPRQRLLGIIARTPNLDWLLLTKRPENIMPAISFLADSVDLRIPTVGSWQGIGLAKHWVNGNPPANVWLGTSCENQETANQRVPHLMKTPAAIRFLSCEPLLGPIDLEECGATPCDMPGQSFGLDGDCNGPGTVWPGVSWVIAGGESGPNARPCHPDWALGLRDQCTDSGIAFFFKQWGEWGPGEGRPAAQKNAAKSIIFSSDGAICDSEDPSVILAYCRAHRSSYPMYRWGKKEAGRKLYSIEWSQFPTPRMEPSP